MLRINGETISPTARNLLERLLEYLLEQKENWRTPDIVKITSRNLQRFIGFLIFQMRRLKTCRFPLVIWKFHRSIFPRNIQNEIFKNTRYLRFSRISFGYLEVSSKYFSSKRRSLGKQMIE